jgi:hypothetical protein
MDRKTGRKAKHRKDRLPGTDAAEEAKLGDEFGRYLFGDDQKPRRRRPRKTLLSRIAGAKAEPISLRVPEAGLRRAREKAARATP